MASQQEAQAGPSSQPARPARNYFNNQYRIDAAVIKAVDTAFRAGSCQHLDGCLDPEAVGMAKGILRMVNHEHRQILEQKAQEKMASEGTTQNIGRFRQFVENFIQGPTAEAVEVEDSGPQPQASENVR